MRINEKTDDTTKRDLRNVETILKSKIPSYLASQPAQITVDHFYKHLCLTIASLYEKAWRSHMPKAYEDLCLELRGKIFEFVEKESELESAHESKSSTSEKNDRSDDEDEPDDEAVSLYRLGHIEIPSDLSPIKAEELMKEMILPILVEQMGIDIALLFKEEPFEKNPWYVLLQTLNQQQLFDSIYKSGRFTLDRKQPSGQDSDAKSDSKSDSKLDAESDPRSEPFATSLQLAIVCRQPLSEIERLLVDEKADPNLTTDDFYKTPCILAAETGQLDVLKLLLKHNADITKKDLDTEFDTIDHAVQYGYVDIVKYLLGDTSLKQKNHLLRIAVRYQQLDVAKLLLESGANADVSVCAGEYEDDEDDKGHNRPRNRFPAVLAAFEDLNMDLVKLLIEKGAKVVFKAAYHNTFETTVSLMRLAIDMGHLPAVKLLLDLKVDLDTAFNVEPNGRDYRVEKNQLVILKYLAEQKLVNPALFALRLENLTALKYFLENGENPTQLLIPAIKHGSDQAFELIMSYKPDVNVTDEKGNTAFECAYISCQYPYHSKRRALLEANAKFDPNKILIPAIKNEGGRELITRAIDQKADVNQADEEGNTPLMYAVSRSHLSIPEALIKAGAILEKTNSKGQTALYRAAEGAYPEVLTMILEHKTTESLVGPMWASVQENLAPGNSCMAILLKYQPELLREKHPEDGATLLMALARYERYSHKISCLIHDFKVGIEEKMVTTGETALLYGIRHADTYNIPYAISCLLENGANVYAVNNDGFNSMELAIKLNHVKIVEYLFIYGNFNMGGIEGAKKLFAQAKSNEVRRLILQNATVELLKADKKVNGGEKTQEESKSQPVTNNFLTKLSKPIVSFFKCGVARKKADAHENDDAGEKFDPRELYNMIIRDEKEISKFIKFKNSLDKQSPLIWICDMAIQMLQPAQASSTSFFRPTTAEQSLPEVSIHVSASEEQGRKMQAGKGEESTAVERETFISLDS